MKLNLSDYSQKRCCHIFEIDENTIQLAFYINTQISNDHEPDRYGNIASDIELGNDFINYSCSRLFDVWLPGAPERKYFVWACNHNLTTKCNNVQITMSSVGIS